MPGTVSDGLLQRPLSSPADIAVEHPSGQLDVLVDFNLDAERFSLDSAGLVRTARKLADGHVYVPRALLD